MQDQTTFHTWLRGRRKELDLSQEVLAERVNCSSEMIRKVEAGRARPSQQLAALLVAALGVPRAEQAGFVQWARGGVPPAPDPVGASPAAVPPPSASVPRSSDRLSPELPTGFVTFLFTDIEGSTQRWEQHPAAMREALAQHDALLRQAIEEQGGLVFQTAGDSFAAAFPQALTALLAALHGQEVLHAATWSELIGPLRVRMALHSGPAEERAGRWHAERTLNRVARLLAAAYGGQILISGMTRDLLQEDLPPGLTLRPMGNRRLKDVSEPLPVFQVVAPDLPADFPPLKTLDPSMHNLPRQATPLIGREREVTAVAALLRQPQIGLVTLTGPGGTGKTRLALQAAAGLLDTFAHGVWFVNLAPLTDPASVASTIAGTLGIPEVGERAVLDSVQDYLRDKQALLILDNFEHLTSAAPVVEALLRAARQLKVLVTSRTPLHLYGEREFLVPPLTLPDRGAQLPLDQLIQYEAIRLFVERAGAVRPDFTLTAEYALAIVEICRRLDGLPLAIELAAARSKLFSPPALLARLEARLGLLTGGSWTLPARQQTLRAALDWSYQLLTIGEQQLFRRMAVFRGGRTLAALEAVCRPAAGTADILTIDVLEGITSLVDKSLVQQRDGRDNEPRFWLLETIHEYASDKLTESGEAEALQANHAAYFLTLAEEAELHTRGSDQAAWMDRLEEEHDNLRVVIRWALDHDQVELALRVCGALEEFWHSHTHYQEGLAWLNEALRQEAQVDPFIQAKALNARAVMLCWMGRFDEGMMDLEASLALFRLVGDKWWLAELLNNVGSISQLFGEYERSRTLLEESRALRNAIGDRAGEAMAVVNLAQIWDVQGDYQQARHLYTEAVRLSAESGWTRMFYISTLCLGIACCRLGTYDQTGPLLTEGCRLAHQFGDRLYLATGLWGWARLARAAGHQERAIRLLAAADGLLHAISATLEPAHQQAYAADRMTWQAVVDAPTWETAWAAGQAMTPDEAVAYALDQADPANGAG